MMLAEDRIEWIKGSLLPRLLLSHEDWKGCEITDSHVQPLPVNTDNWASNLYFLNVTLTARDGVNMRQDLAIKVIPDDPNIRTCFNSEKQFANEIHFYDVILPFFSSIRGHRDSPNPDFRFSTSRYPKCFYSCLKGTDAEPDKEPTSVSKEDGIVVLEDLRSEGYKLGPRESLDYDHCRMAMEEISRLHGLSYAGKLLFPREFNETVVRDLQETNYIPNPTPGDKVDYIKIALRRVLDLMNVEVDGNYSESLKRLNFTDHSLNVMFDLVQPKEPLAVLCHGDFCRNNMMFQYDDDVGGRPKAIKLLDFQTMRYASPAIDLSFFLYMNTTRELRRDHLDDLFRCYHDGVMRTMREYLDDIPPGFCLEAFLEDFKRHAMYGYIVTVFFLPCMLCSKEELDAINRIVAEYGMDSLQNAEASAKLGGQTMTDMLLDLTKELFQGGYI